MPIDTVKVYRKSDNSVCVINTEDYDEKIYSKDATKSVNKPTVSKTTSRVSSATKPILSKTVK